MSIRWRRHFHTQPSHSHYRIPCLLKIINTKAGHPLSPLSGLSLSPSNNQLSDLKTTFHSLKLCTTRADHHRLILTAIVQSQPFLCPFSDMKFHLACLILKWTLYHFLIVFFTQCDSLTAIKFWVSLWKMSVVWNRCNNKNLAINTQCFPLI